jgi:Sulfotransferase domain
MTPRPPSLTQRMKAPLRWVRAHYRELTGPLRGLPSLLIIGAQRSGTTSLFNYLVRHPDARAPLSKEVHYFDLHYSRGERWYRGQFPFDRQLRHGVFSLDASPYYLVHPRVPERAARLLPDIKLVAVLRDPVERAFSHYQHELRERRESLSFPEAIDREAERLAGEEERLAADGDYYSYNHHRYSYTRRGLYLEQLRRWTRHFPRSQLLVLQSEQLFRDPAGASASVYRFLGVRPHRLEHYPAFFPGNYDREMPPALRTRLSEYFAPHNRELYRWLGEDFGWT